VLHDKISSVFSAQVISDWMRDSKASTKRLVSARVYVRDTAVALSVNWERGLIEQAAVGFYC